MEGLDAVTSSATGGAPPPPILAVDVGLADVAMAVVRAPAPHARPRAELLVNAEGHELTPAAVHVLAPDDAIAGHEARAAAPLEPSSVVDEIPARLGGRAPDVEVDGHPWSAVALLAVVLRKLRDDAEALLGAPVTDAAFGVHGFFDSAQRAGLEQAAQIAGLRPRSITQHATAVAHAQVEGRDAPLLGGGRTLVLDVRRRGIEATLLRAAGDELVVLASAAAPDHGGARWEDHLVEALAQRWASAAAPPGGASAPDPRQDPWVHKTLRDAARGALARLAHHAEAQVTVGPSGAREPVTLSREALTRDTWPWVVEATAPALRCLEKVGLTDRALDAVLLVGDAATLPGLQRCLTHALGVRPTRAPAAHGVAARGLATLAHHRRRLDAAPSTAPATPMRAYGGRPSSLARAPSVHPAAPTPDADAASRPAFGLADGGHESDAAPAPRATPLRVREPTSRTLGLLVHDAQGHERVVPLIAAGTPLPARSRRRFGTAYDGATHLTLAVTEGEGERREDVSLIGTIEITDLPPRPRGTPIEITCAYDESQILRVEVTDLDTGEVRAAQIQFRGSLPARGDRP